MTVTDKDLILEEINRRWNLDNACYHSVKNISFSHLLSKDIKICKTTVLLVVP
jgi:hypothetical protein